MKKSFFILLISLSGFLSAQFFHPIVGINSEYVGSCLTTTCGGTYVDNGGAGNYALNIGFPAPGGIYRVFCPDAAFNCMRVTFNAFDVEFQAACGWDYLTIGNGPTQNSAFFTTPPALASGRICGTPVTPFSYTSTDPSGCLTFRFYSDNVITRPGWSAVLSCVACAIGPNGTDNNDCNLATPLCNNASLSDNSTGPGIVAEGCNGSTCPAGGENFSNWYQFQIATGGTLTFTISPFNAGQDYDFAIYGPGTPCSALGVPIRCNDSGITGNTGLSSTALNPVEIVTGPTFCSQMVVVAGQTYYMVIDSWSPPAIPVGYNLTWGGTATFNCAILPVEMVNFSAVYNMSLKQSELNWTTILESNVEFYSIERSVDAQNFKEINKVFAYGTGNSKEIRNYHGIDPNPVTNEINYYRIITVDKNSHKTISNLQAVAFQDNDANLSLIPNPASTEVELRFKSQIGKNWGINLYDSKGNNLQLLSYDATVEGINKIVLDVRELNSGLYFINISDGTNFFKRKLIKE